MVGQEDMTMTGQHARWELTREKYMTPQQLERLTDYCIKASEFDETRGRKANVRTWMAVHLGVGAGLRVSEIADVRVSDCRIGRGQSEVVVRNGKNKKRGIVIVGKSLKRHIKAYLKLKRRWGEDMSDDAPLILSERGGAFSTRGLQLKFKGVAAKAGLPPYLSIHCLRHTFGVNLLRETKNLRLVQKQMRHSNIQTTCVYADVADDEIQGAMDRLL